MSGQPKKRNGCKRTKQKKELRKSYRVQWVEYFRSIYGDSVDCSICGEQLYWSHDEIGKRVNFDHRHGDEPITGKPSMWARSHKCNDVNKKIWRSCNFGILCSKCNRLLPLAGRKRFARALARYAGVIK